MAVGRDHGLNNQEGMLHPHTSPWGQALLAGRAQTVAHPAPIGTDRKKAFGGTVGGVSTASANVIALVGPSGYYGDLPQTQQDLVNAPDPWNRD